MAAAPHLPSVRARSCLLGARWTFDKRSSLGISALQLAAVRERMCDVVSDFRDAIAQALADYFNNHKRSPWDRIVATPQDMIGYADAILAMPEMVRVWKFLSDQWLWLQDRDDTPPAIRAWIETPEVVTVTRPTTNPKGPLTATPVVLIGGDDWAEEAAVNDDIVDRLRSQHGDLRQGAYYTTAEDPTWDATSDAADEIERLRAEVARYRSEVERWAEDRIATQDEWKATR